MEILHFNRDLFTNDRLVLSCWRKKGLTLLPI